jgi:hypothetical protein
MNDDISLPIEWPLERRTASFEASLREAPHDKEF